MGEVICLDHDVKRPRRGRGNYYNPEEPRAVRETELAKGALAVDGGTTAPLVNGVSQNFGYFYLELLKSFQPILWSRYSSGCEIEVCYAVKCYSSKELFVRGLCCSIQQYQRHQKASYVCYRLHMLYSILSDYQSFYDGLHLTHN